MKFNKLFLGAALLSMGVFTSCSNDDEPANNGGQGNVKGDGYIAVKFQTAGLGGSRAAGEGFEESLSTEGTVTNDNTRFYFFDADGMPFRMADAGNINGTVSDEADNMVTPFEINTDNTDGRSAVEGMLVLGKGTDGYKGLVPYQAVCVSNGTKTFMESLANKTLKALAEEVAKGDDNLFMMSSSNYKGALGNGAVTIGDKIKSTPEAANQDPVDFYLERLAVKVRIKSGQEVEFTAQEATQSEGSISYSDAKYSIYQADGSVKKDVNLRVVLADWLLVKTTDNAYTIKQLPATDPWTNWSNASYHRSYWAVSSAESVNKPYFDIYNAITNDNQVNTDWTSLSSTGLYTWEWTKAANVDSENDRDHKATATSVVIRANVKENIANEGEKENWQNIELVKWAGTYYTLAAFKQQVVNTYNPTATSAVTVDDVELVYVGGNDARKGKGGEDNYWKVQVKGADYSQYTQIKYWKNGVTSFYLNIKHANDNDGKNIYGVVRNHIYEYSIDKIVGLGVPGNNPDKEAGETFVSASLNVLNWKVVSNSVTLE